MKGEKRKERLSPRLAKTYKALWDLYRKMGVPPAVREVVRKMNLTDRYVSRVHGDLEEMVKLGVVERKEIPTRCFAPGPLSPDEINWDELVDPR